ncbi:MAG: MotA/TolQ/ExbB proton channel family protein [Proteobacteria bacterium]|nr:MotA/TolQ/ExbB proton channel family protein [Pseudomonadota bacterium]
MHLFAELLRGFSPDQNGFLFMWSLATIALVAAALVIERWLELRRRTDVNAPLFAERIRRLIVDRKMDEAYRLCMSGGQRALPSIFGAGIEKAVTSPRLVRAAMEEESSNIIPSMNRRVGLIRMFGNVSTLLGLMGTIYGLILSFASVGRPGIAAVEKTLLLASGISTAMNTTLLGLIISIPCLMTFSMFRTRIDAAVQEFDRYTLSVVKVLIPDEKVINEHKFSERRIKKESENGVNMGPLMSLIVILIPLLLTSAEFVKIGALEIKLPPSQEEASLSPPQTEKSAADTVLALEVEVREEGFNINHYFMEQEGSSRSGESELGGSVEIPLSNGSYDFDTLKERLAEVKRMALFEIMKTVNQDLPADSSLAQLFNEYLKMRSHFSIAGLFSDHESVQISAEEMIKYQTLVSVMDTAREIWTDNGRVAMFPDVYLSGGLGE